MDPVTIGLGLLVLAAIISFVSFLITKLYYWIGGHRQREVSEDISRGTHRESNNITLLHLPSNREHRPELVAVATSKL